MSLSRRNLSGWNLELWDMTGKQTRFLFLLFDRVCCHVLKPVTMSSLWPAVSWVSNRLFDCWSWRLRFFLIITRIYYSNWWWQERRTGFLRRLYFWCRHDDDELVSLNRSSFSLKVGKRVHHWPVHSSLSFLVFSGTGLNGSSWLTSGWFLTCRS